MLRITGAIEGVAPILFGRWVTSLEGAQPTTTEDRIAEAEQKVYRDDDGLYFPAWNLKRALVDGCIRADLRETDAGFGKRARGLATTLMATVFVERDPRFDRAEADFMHEVPGRRPPKKGGAVLVRRPGLNQGWGLAFALTVTDARVQPEAIRSALDATGLLVGIGSWRPEYGRFVVRDWQVSK